MSEIHNVDRMPDEYVDDPKFKSKLSTKYLAALAGSERLYVNIDSVKPRAKSVKYHSHSLQEEFFLILKGKGRVRLDGKTIPVQRGDFLAKPAGKGITHQFINDGDEVLEILDCGTPDKNDIITYPDEDTVLNKKTGTVLRGSDQIEGLR
jgi:uncharacterized cupin superfamily protein